MTYTSHDHSKKYNARHEEGNEVEHNECMHFLKINNNKQVIYSLLPTLITKEHGRNVELIKTIW